eukprot:UN26184
MYSPEKYKVPIVVASATIGGFASGNLWTAQGSYFSELSRLYAEQLDDDIDVSSKLAGYFAFLYLVGEVVCKSLSSYLYNYG